MSARDQLNQLLATISRHDLSLDANNSCQIKTTKGMVCVVELMPGTERAMGYIPLLRLPATDSERAAMMQTALSLNLDYLRETTLTFVYDHRMDSLVLSTCIDVCQATAEDFDNWLATLVRVSVPARQRLLEGPGQRKTPSEPSPEPQRSDVPFQV